ncbi:hypothetical protein H6F43_00290 [Leptolyngbya sp. FACHB-36]|uniref:hypothetical protein n=1 Tax=Leptolyngbya sp. FACHB-36 TaxID=2692808 RepID=UPI0016813F10|nr:hypothetical protein [Leptolyngbya sp. FACHB-36]MBD2018622.1 hypothetical protein [Leptolyngbya sp. FACHB-36]
MTIESAPLAPPYIATLQAATLRGAARPRADAVVNALLQAEKTAKQEHLVYPIAPLLGQWQLCFVTGTRKVRRGGVALGRGFYVPRLAPAQISFETSTEAMAIGNQVQFGPVRLQLTGPARYVGKKNLVAFDFNQWRLNLFGRSFFSGAMRGGKVQAEKFEQQSIAQLPFFSFFLITEDFIAARGRGGGLALWVRVTANSAE